MKITIPEISWHNRDPVFSLDVQAKPQDGWYRLATAGTDTHVVIWQLRVLENGAVSVEVLSDLTRHNRAVNVVRFAPEGDILASADDEAAVILWKKEESSDIFMEESEKENREHWTVWKMLRGHLEDVYDLCWSPCSLFLFTGAVDNAAILWDVTKGKSLSLFSDHKGFVQGVAWDPLSQYIATLCSDRYCRIFSVASKKIAHRIYKTVLPIQNQDDTITEKTTKLFYDDTLKSFCRRLSFSPDGELLLTPSGIVEEENGTITNVTYVFSRHNLAKPVLYLPTKDKYTLAVRFCPVLFELKPLPKEEGATPETAEAQEPWEEHGNLFHLPYRMVFAVATQNAVLLYDTQQPVPFGRLSNIHYTRLSDLSWSSDGLLLVMSSTDGYCSLVSFTKGELGTPYVGKTSKASNTDKQNSCKVAESVNKVETEMEEESKTKTVSSSLAESIKPSSKTPEEVKPGHKTSDAAPKKQMTVRRAGDSSKTTKRIALITLSGPSHKTDENTPVARAEPLTTTATPQTQEEPAEVDEETRKRFEGEAVTPSKVTKAPSPSKTPTGKTPRRTRHLQPPPKHDQHDQHKTTVNSPRQMAGNVCRFFTQIKELIIWSWSYLWALWFLLVLAVVYYLRGPLKITDNIAMGYPVHEFLNVS
ncbi:Chromatin assembly factor 1 subunit B [Chionoecetes opilio]|uniref:Chromatin assembly factor 1 subunit B n=1 Tax=Chionoecetes opilio TaxID=41210 RepID=A0A8J5CLI6_CHIOP|nr:Chromatin assembly factor 1 subunit B [Chionoecetes opilio]